MLSIFAGQLILDGTTLESTDRTLVSNCKMVYFCVAVIGSREWTSEGRRPNPPGFYNFTFPDEIFIKKVCFLSFEEEKQNFTTFGPSLKNFWKHPVLESSWKTSFHPHGYSTYTQGRDVDISQFLRIFRLCPKWFLCT